MAKVTSNELLDVPRKKKTNALLLSGAAAESTIQARRKPNIGKSVLDVDQLKSRLQGFIPKLKAANDSLPEDSSTLDIEHVTKEGPYIEMDLGLGVLEERDDDDDSSGQSEVMENFLSGNNSTSTKPSIIEMQDASSLPESPLLCDEALKHHRAACPSGSLQQLDIVLSLMSRILIQLRKPHTTVESITKINVIQEDMYKLMRRRDLLLKPSDAKPTHESIYQDELDTLLNA